MFPTPTERPIEVGSPTSEESRLILMALLSMLTFAPAALEAVRLPELYKLKLNSKNEAVL